LEALGKRVAVPVLVVLGWCGEQDLVASAALCQRPDCRCGVIAAVHEGHWLVVGGAAYKAARLCRRPVGSVRMALRRDHERDLTAIAGAVLNLVQQLRLIP